MSQDLKFQIVKEIPIKCGDCGILLATAVVKDTDESIRSSVQIINCPKCRGSSFVTPVIVGQFVIETIHDVVIKDQKEEKTHIKYIFVVSRTKK